MQVRYFQTSFLESRCTLENWNGKNYDFTQDINPETGKAGIRCHHFITALFLRLLGKIHIEQTADGQTVYLNKNSFHKWCKWRFPEDREVEEKDQGSTINNTDEVARRNFDSLPDISSSENALSEEDREFGLDSETEPSDRAQDNSEELNQPPPEADESVFPQIVQDPTETVFAEQPMIDLFQEVPVSKVSSKPFQHSQAVNAFLETLNSYELFSLNALWESLLFNVPQDHITSFEEIEANKFQLTFSKRITLWLDSRDKHGKSNPEGGTLVHLGDRDQPSISFMIHQSPPSIQFLRGMQFYCDTLIGMKEITVVNMRSDEETITIEAGCKLPIVGLQTEERAHSKDSLIETWSQATYLDEEVDYKKYLKDKFLQQKRRA